MESLDEMHIAESCVSGGTGGTFFFWIIWTLEAFWIERLLAELEVVGELVLEAVGRVFV